MLIPRWIAACLIVSFGGAASALAQVQPIDQLKVISAQLEDAKAKLDAYVASQVPVNRAPVVTAGSNQTLTLPALATLDGTATDDGLPAGSTLTQTWSRVNGPGTVTFGDITARITTASFSAAGTYVLRLTASDSVFSTPADVTVNVSVSPAASCSGVTVPLTTTNLQAVVSAQPAGTTFCFQPGTYRLAGPVLAKSSDQFIGQPGAILDGQGKITRAIWGYGGLTGQRDVVVRGLALTGFTDSAVVMGWYWTVKQNNIHHNRIGVTVNSYGVLEENLINDNTQYGLNGGPGRDMLIVNNEVARNNTGKDCGGTCGGDAGGTKIVGSTAGTTNLIFRNNNVHDNTGPGLWCDGNCRGTIYEGNTISNNTNIGIFDEISWDAKIRNNTLTNNGSDIIGKSCWWGSNIFIGTSSNVEVSGNTVVATNGSNAICIVSADRDEPPPYSMTAANNYVHDNTVYLAGAARVGFVKGADNPPGNRFVNNTYWVSNLTQQWFSWPTVYMATWTQWQAAGQDKAGTLTLTKP